jgi:hypothetical protein
MRLLLLCIVAIGLLIIAFLAWVVLKPGPTDIDDQDQIALNALRESGSDLTQPTEINHYLYFPSQKVAQQVAAVLTKDGYVVKVDMSAVPRPGQEWLALATQTAVPTIAYLRKTRNQLNKIATKFNGVYDGWEAAKK